VINDGPMVTPRQRKDFQTTAVVMGSDQALGSLTWGIEHDGTRAVIHPVACHEQPQPTVEFGTPGHDDMLRDFYRTHPRSW